MIENFVIFIEIKTRIKIKYLKINQNREFSICKLQLAKMKKK